MFYANAYCLLLLAWENDCREYTRDRFRSGSKSGDLTIHKPSITRNSTLPFHNPSLSLSLGEFLGEQVFSFSERSWLLSWHPPLLLQFCYPPSLFGNIGSKGKVRWQMFGHFFSSHFLITSFPFSPLFLSLTIPNILSTQAFNPWISYFFFSNSG